MQTVKTNQVFRCYEVERGKFQNLLTWFKKIQLVCVFLSRRFIFLSPCHPCYPCCLFLPSPQKTQMNISVWQPFPLNLKMHVASTVEGFSIFQNHGERSIFFEDEAINKDMVGSANQVPTNFATKDFRISCVVLNVSLSVSKCSADVLVSISKYREVFNILVISGECRARPGGHVFQHEEGILVSEEVYDVLVCQHLH